jgi:hypothetical protein
MPILQMIRGHIVGLHCYTNVHLYWRSRPGPPNATSSGCAILPDANTSSRFIPAPCRCGADMRSPC